MKYIVTGASGLIGSAAVWALNKAGEHDILAVDHLGTSEKWKNLRALRFTDYMERDTFMEYLLQGDILFCLFSCYSLHLLSINILFYPTEKYSAKL